MDLQGVRELYSVETRTLFDTIDKLSSLGISNVVDPPQVVVVGDQSSGKSSVLQAISHATFPFKAGIRTRFATELVLRRGPRRCARASVRFFDSSKAPVELEVNQIDSEPECFDSVIDAAKEVMGLNESDHTSSNGLLRFELEGPDVYPPTLVDLPGMSPGETRNQTPDYSVALSSMINALLKKDNSIVLAIVPAIISLTDQSVLRMIAEQGFDQERLLGVITKLDLLESESPDGREYIQAVRGRQTAHTLRHGFHVLRNEPGGGCLDVRNNIEEEFFDAKSWSSLPAHRCGITALVKRLSPLIHSHIAKTVPGILVSTQEKLAELRIELEVLGPSRSDSLEMRGYLVKLASGFERLVREGMQGHYNDPFFGGSDNVDQRLRLQLQRSHGAIRYILSTKGSLYEILQDAEDKPPFQIPPWHV